MFDNLIRTLLAFVALFGVACFWVTRPKRVAETFVVDYFHELDSQNPFREGTPEAAAFAKLQTEAAEFVVGFAPPFDYGYTGRPTDIRL